MMVKVGKLRPRRSRVGWDHPYMTRNKTWWSNWEVSVPDEPVGYARTTLARAKDVVAELRSRHRTNRWPLFALRGK